MTFEESIKQCFRQYASFQGRASRSEYWWFVLFTLLGGAAASVIHDKLATLFWLAVLLPSLAVSTRRLHDTQRSGWWQLVGLIPLIGMVILLVFMAQKGPEQDSASKL